MSANDEPTSWRIHPSPEPGIRRAFLDERRRSSASRLGALGETYDRDWGAIPPSHERFLRRLVELTRAGGTVLDAACGTGRPWPQLLAAGLTVVGTDQSIGLLGIARSKHPAVPTGLVGLQELAFEATFDGVLCLDALENVGPEDWPMVARRLAAAARPGGPVYLTVEIAGEDELRRAYEEACGRGDPVVPGEDFDGVGYHFYPERADVRRWLDQAGLDLLEEADGDWYWHLLLRRRGRADASGSS